MILNASITFQVPFTCSRHLQTIIPTSPFPHFLSTFPTDHTEKLSDNKVGNRTVTNMDLAGESEAVGLKEKGNKAFQKGGDQSKQLPLLS